MSDALSEARRALLQRYLRGTSNAIVIPKRSGTGPAPLSWSQQQIWLHAQMAGDAPIYNEPITIRRRGNLNHDALERAFTEVVSRHEAWRTTFAWEGEEGAQFVQPAPARIQIPHSHLSTDAEAIALAREDARVPFDLDRGPLYRARLVSLGDDDHRLYLTLHHLIFDGVSLYRVFLPELLKFYEGFAREQPTEVAALPIQYPDFATWQRDEIKAIAPADFAYWEAALKGAPILDLITDRPRPPQPTYAGAAELIHIPAATSDGLKALSQKQNATPFMAMVAAFLALLQSESGQQEIVIGGVSSGREHEETMNLLGCFLNTVPIRCAFAQNHSFIELLARVRTATLEALSHDRVPFELLVQNFAPRDPSRAPLVQALIVVEPPLAPLAPGWSFTHMDVDTGTAKFDLQLGLDDRPEGLSGRFIYNTDLFERATIERLKVRWLEMLDRIVAAPETPLIRLTSNPKYPLAEWNATQTNFPSDATIHQLFEAEVRRAPAAVALMFEGATVSYDELNRRANRLARKLRKLGVKRDQPVAVCLERSTEMVVALLAILKAGGAYVPIDPAYPEERREWMLRDIQAAVILTRAEIETPADEDESDLDHESAAGDLAYIIYTSGSTGTPKGVAVPHRAVVRLVRETNYAKFSPNETFLQLAPISFDASTFEIWGALLHGGKLVIMPPAAPTLEEIGRAICAHGVTTLWLTSALFNAMVDERLDDLRPVRQLLAGGDVLSVSHVRKVVSELLATQLINGYGPTECTTFACCYSVPPNESFQRAIPIGRPIANTTAHILDANLKPVTIGASGDLYLGGAGLARGYWRQPELTTEKFISYEGARVYKTGDLARWREDGAIEFLGRSDQQIKLRGYRIEPGEIENALRQQAGVLDCAALLREDLPNEKKIVAYFTGSADVETLTASLRKILPEYMVPAAIVAMSSLPRTANGKLDRQSLPAPKIAKDFTAARSAMEEKLAAIWARVLGRECVGVEENFFDLGGHSLLGLRLANQLREALGREVPLTLIFEAPTISEMARALEQTSPPAARSIAPIHSINRESRRARRA